jgi:hypothetical protein
VDLLGAILYSPEKKAISIKLFPGIFRDAGIFEGDVNARQTRGFRQIHYDLPGEAAGRQHPFSAAAPQLIKEADRAALKGSLATASSSVRRVLPMPANRRVWQLSPDGERTEACSKYSWTGPATCCRTATEV